MRSRPEASLWTIIFKGSNGTSTNLQRNRAVFLRSIRASLFLVMLTASTGGGVAASIDAGNDYPTQARAEFVFACMASNGQTQQALRQCSCVIDVIASLLPYDRYEKAETVMRMRRGGGGYLGDTFRTATANNVLRDLQEAEAEGDVRCF